MWSKEQYHHSEHSDFVLKSISELLVNGFAVLSEEKLLVVNPISVSVQANGKKCLIADLRHLNEALNPPHFKMEDLHAAMPALVQSEYLISFDLAKGFYDIDLHEDVWKYFGFQFVVNSTVYYAMYTICPFGLAMIPWLFTKMMRVWQNCRRSLVLDISIFLDDSICRWETE